jgi:Ribonuclease G/E
MVERRKEDGTKIFAEPEVFGEPEDSRMMHVIIRTSSDSSAKARIAALRLAEKYMQRYSEIRNTGPILRCTIPRSM